MAQLAFDLGHRPALGRNDFFVTGCNAEAVASIDRWPDWPAPGLALWGPPACGKSHLAAVWRGRSEAPTIGLDALEAHDPPEILGDRCCLVVDAGAAPGVPQHLEETLLHTYNLVVERGGNLLITSRDAPARWPTALADLSSRLRAMGSVSIAPPDDDLLRAVLLKQFADRQISVNADLISYALARMERSFEAAYRLVDALDREALARGKPIGLALLRTVLGRETD